MTEPIIYPPVELPSSRPLGKWEREYRAFHRLLPELLQTHVGKYVAIHGERVVGSGEDKVALALETYRQHGYVPIYVGLVTTPPGELVRVPHYRITGPDRTP